MVVVKTPMIIAAIGDETLSFSDQLEADPTHGIKVMTDEMVKKINKWVSCLSYVNGKSGSSTVRVSSHQIYDSKEVT